MTAGAKYTKIVEWSDKDECFIGSCPELFYGGCHGNDEREVFDQLCHIVDENIALLKQDGKPLPSPLSGKELVNALQHVA